MILAFSTGITSDICPKNTFGMATSTVSGTSAHLEPSWGNQGNHAATPSTTVAGRLLSANPAWGFEPVLQTEAKEYALELRMGQFRRLTISRLPRSSGFLRLPGLHVGRWVAGVDRLDAEPSPAHPDASEAHPKTAAGRFR
jgi:hypothetical protein